MSYDMFFFQMADGVSVEEINAYLKSDAYKAYCDRRMGEEDADEDDEEMEEEDEAIERDEDEDEAEEEDPPLIPARFINMELEEEDLQHQLFRSWLKQTTKPEERSEAMQEYIDGETEEMPDECEDDFECLFEYGGEPGMQPMMFSYSGDLDGTLSLIAKMLEDLQAQRIALFDPQLEQVVFGAAQNALQQSGQEAKQNFDDMIQRLMTEGFVPLDAPDEDEPK